MHVFPMKLLFVMKAVTQTQHDSKEVADNHSSEYIRAILSIESIPVSTQSVRGQT